MELSLRLLLASCLSLGAAGEFDRRWPRHMVSSAGLCRFGSRIDCCWGWARVSWGQCQPFYVLRQRIASLRCQPKAICQPGCKHGECIGPNKCKCHPGYIGKTCNQDLNECGLKPRPCKHRCMNTYGSYKCYCLNGYMLMPDGTCSNALSCLMANCQYGCDVLKGEVRCRCPSPGLQLGPDGRTCIEKPMTRPTARPTPEPTARPTPEPTTRPTPRTTAQPTPGPTTRLTPKPTTRYVPVTTRPTTRYVPVTTRPTTRYVPVTTRPVTTPAARPPPPPQPTTIRPTLPPQRPPLIITEEPSQVPIETTSLQGIIDDNRIQPDPQKPRGDVFIPRQPGVSNNLLEILEIERGITADEFEANDDPGVLVHSCNFDSGLCGWIKDKDDDLHWEPVRDGSGGQYLTISDPKGQEGRAAHLILPLDHMAQARDLCLSFRHKVPGLHSGALQVFVRKNGAHGPAVWGRNGGHGWRQTHITLRGLGIKSVIFKGEKGKGRTGDIGLDDVILRRGRCSEEH
ncbi:nephronectin isoform X7 [Manacus candei]|uniref:nephronectin isoform X7 n=1 Tax=Manacus candei TaxID=415023 RepID=UPI00222733FA|nr:nephronectin isoform X7 [Manacus candei]